MNKKKTLLIGAMLAVSVAATVSAAEIKTVTGINVNATEYTQNAYGAATNQAAVVFEYVPNELYKIYTAPGYVTDIRFQPGEEITYVGGGDTARWVIDKGVMGNDYQKESHLYIKPLRRDIRTNIIVNTNLHSYQIEVNAGNTYNPIISWAYSQEQSSEAQRRLAKLREDQMMTVDPGKLNFGYKISNKSANFAPVQVFDDGRKTFLKMKTAMATANAPAFFINNKRGESVLANYRVATNYYVVDRLFDKATLIVGTEKVEIKKE
jgi:P-type conjugative transfer protein TrbG